jgi:AcrR family transcriptional regulator
VGRARVIDRQAVLDAAERVVVRQGASHLTLEAVAIEAGISKASVIYDYKSKNALIKAVIERAIARHTAQLDAHIEEQTPGPDRFMRGRLVAAAEHSVTDAERAVALNLIAALAFNAELRALVEAVYRQQMSDIAATSSHPRGAILAFLALEGMSLMERFGFYSWPAAERDALLRDIGAMLERSGDRADVPI